ncbi:MAG: o-succinylbenzoate synthase [Actinomycetota bacterium]
MPGRLRAVELVHVRMPLVRPFATVHGVTRAKDSLLVRVVYDGVEGWGECAVETEPGYTGETLDGARVALREYLVPRVFAGRDLGNGRGNEFARSAFECALLDAQLHAAQVSLASHIGGVRDHVTAGVAIGLHDDIGALRALAAEYVAQGYTRLKLKIVPGRDIEPVAAVRDEVGPDVAIAVDANGSYSFEAAMQLAALDAFGLQCIEQPLSPDAFEAHALLAAGLVPPLCLDESITSAPLAELAISLGACGMVNVKPGRVGGIEAARAVHDACRIRAVPVLIGGMLETGIGRAVNIALASLPGFTETGDCSASDRYFADDLTEPFGLEGGTLAVPTGPGIGVVPRAEVLRAQTVRRERLRP